MGLSVKDAFAAAHVMLRDNGGAEYTAADQVKLAVMLLAEANGTPADRLAASVDRLVVMGEELRTLVVAGLKADADNRAAAAATRGRRPNFGD